MSNKAKRFLTILITIILVILSLLLLSVYFSYHKIETSDYNVTSGKINSEISFVILSDLHDSQFGKDNTKLIQKVRECEPDIILTVGDMVSNYTEDYSYLAPLYSSLSEIASTYCSLGNHELSHPDSEKIKEILGKHANLLDNEYMEITVNGTDIRLGGLMGYHPENEELNAFIRNFADTDKFTLLLSHCPEYYTWGVDEVKIDLMVSGHTHGGQVILPFLGGAFAPEQGYFPHFDYGVFYEDNATLVITRGLGSSKQPAPRFNNPPEVLSLKLSPEVSYEH